MKTKNANSSDIVFYDGNCPLCHGVVAILLKIDTSPYLSYAPLQGETAKRLLPNKLTKKLSSVIFLSNKSNNEPMIYTESDAVLEILKKNRLIISLIAKCFKIIPKPIRDFFYRFISKHRAQIFGVTDQCILADDKYSSRLLP